MPPKADERDSTSGADPSPARPAKSRVLTAALRAELNLPIVKRAPYRWAFACIVVGTACLPLVLASMWKSALFAVFVGLVVVPGVRWFEAREATWREQVYRTGTEVKGRVLDIEPAGAGRRDHLVRVEFFAGGTMVRASVLGCPLAQNELRPLDDVAIVYDPNSPMRCLVVRKTETEIVDAIFDD
jgi:hypothetical protein